MKDYEELVSGLANSRNRFLQNTSVRNALTTPEQYERFREQVLWIRDQSGKGLLFDIYIACFAGHDPPTMMVSSMWRGYGANSLTFVHGGMTVAQ